MTVDFVYLTRLDAHISIYGDVRNVHVLNYDDENHAIAYALVQ